MPTRLNELKQAHASLLEEYLHVLEDLSYQSFIVDLNPDRTAFKDVRGMIPKLKWISSRLDRKVSVFSKALCSLVFRNTHPK